MREVVVAVVPIDAMITRDGQDLGAPPVLLHLNDGETASLVVTRRGYKTKTVSVDPAKPKLTVKLDRDFGASPAGGGAARPPSGGIDDVGDPFAKH
jgi:hypothetical protein